MKNITALELIDTWSYAGGLALRRCWRFVGKSLNWRHRGLAILDKIFRARRLFVVAALMTTFSGILILMTLFGRFRFSLLYFLAVVIVVDAVVAIVVVVKVDPERLVHESRVFVEALNSGRVVAILFEKTRLVLSFSFFLFVFFGIGGF